MSNCVDGSGEVDFDCSDEIVFDPADAGETVLKRIEAGDIARDDPGETARDEIDRSVLPSIRSVDGGRLSRSLGSSMIGEYGRLVLGNEISPEFCESSKDKIVPSSVFCSSVFSPSTDWPR